MFLRLIAIFVCLTYAVSAIAQSTPSTTIDASRVGAPAEAAPEAAPVAKATLADPTVVLVDPTIHDSAVLTGPNLPPAVKPTPDYEAWERTAKRGERMTEVDIASLFAFNRLRGELVVWRDLFATELSRNGNRLGTVRAQINALGPVPETGEEPAPIAARRADLALLVDRLGAPSRLAQEAYVRADGLIGEVDGIIRSRQIDRLQVRGPSPLSPENWSEAAKSLVDGWRGIWSEVRAGISADVASGALWRNLPLTILLVTLSFVLLIRGRPWVANLQTEGSRTGLISMFVSVGQFLVPMVGLFALTGALTQLDVFGLRSSAMIASLPLAGTLVILARWLSIKFFPTPPHQSLMGYSDDTNRRGRRVTVALSWSTAIWLPLEALLFSGDASPEAQAVVFLPLMIVLAVLLLRLGQLIARPVTDRNGNLVSTGRVRRIIGPMAQVVAVVAPVLAIFGYGIAAEAFLFPTIVTLAVFGIIVVLQRLTFDIYAAWSGREDDATEALMPLLIGFVLIVIALPGLALVWGARVDDLSEIWTRFREGFDIGTTRISPTVFMTFVGIFLLGYFLTRFIQGSLRNTVLPRTKMDIGGRNAVVSGFGYVGIFLSAIIAITTAGIDLSSLAIVAGALSVGIGFGLQNIVSNFVSGIILLIERPVSAGDWIEVGGQMGYVRDISVRSTRIETFDRTDVIIPNADLVSGQVTNWTRGNLIGRVIVPVGVAYGTDTDRVAKILQEIAEAHPMVVVEPPPAVLFQAFGADSLDFEIRAILRDVNFVGITKSELNFAIAKRFAAEGIEIPFAQRDIWLRNPEVLQAKKE